MDEFLKLNWRIQDHAELENQVCTFLSEEAISNSYIYKNFSKPLSQTKEKEVKLGRVDPLYVPGGNLFREIKKKSSLTKNEKEHCFTAFKFIQTGKSQSAMNSNEKYALEVYSKCQAKLVEENRQFLEYIEGIWTSKNSKYVPKIPPGIFGYSKDQWTQKCKNVLLKYPQLYSEVSVIRLNYDESEGTVQYECTCNALEMGTLARFSQPKLKGQCTLNLNTLPSVNESTISSKQPVSEDKNVEKLLEKHEFNFVISSSGLNRILDNTDPKARWILPVIVKEMTVEGKKSRKVAFIDKVLPKTAPQYFDLKMYTFKRLLKTNFCEYDAFTFPATEDIEQTDENNEEFASDCDQDDANVEEPVAKKSKREKRGVIHHNVSYRIWNVKKTGQANEMMKNIVKDVEMNILIRTKLDACEITDQSVLQPVIVKPKIESQLEYGATIPSKSDLAREWTSLFFRPYSNLYRARLISKQSEVISVEKCSLQKINTEAYTHYDYKPNLGLGILQKVLEEVGNLEPGNYLLQHLPKHGYFVALLKEAKSDGGIGNIFDLHSEYADCKVDFKTGENWLPVDVNYILPIHESLKQVPATFSGFGKNNLKKGKKKKGGAKNNRKEGSRDDGEEHGAAENLSSLTIN